MRYLFFFLILFCFSGCVKTNMYEFWIENQTNDKTVKIVPTSKSDFWITSNDEYIVRPHEKIIVGSRIVDNGRLKAKDLYSPNDIIIPFDVYIGDIKQEKTLSFRKFWDFSLGKVDVSGKYILVINDNILKD